MLVGIFRKIYKSGEIFNPLNFCGYVIQILRKTVLSLSRVVSSIVISSQNQVNPFMTEAVII